ncbi:MAG TPA: N-acetylglucosamine-6-phosphate deacetylase, partial [Gammaproteobacteria bacterium]|nr:N-acetylglucosamine-6-phosphate deacetylase [Gammaproteobacteria bacterium]
MSTALVNARVLTPEGFKADRAVLVKDGRVEDLVPASDPRLKAAERHDLAGRTLLPGFIDCQVNGGGGALFNATPSVDGIRTIALAHRRFGTTGLLPTVISDSPEVMRAAVAAVDAALATVPGVLGIHIEGPYLAPARKGVHAEATLRRPEAAESAWLAGALKRGKCLVTLAPEQVPPGFIRALASSGVIVAIGHTDGDYLSMRRALADGARGFTHLYNAMSPLKSREPGAVGAALEDPASWCGIIVDGHHVHPASLRVALTAKPRGKLFLVTDAMPTVGAADPSFLLNGEAIVERD